MEDLLQINGDEKMIKIKKNENSDKRNGYTLKLLKEANKFLNRDLNGIQKLQIDLDNPPINVW